MRAKFIAAVLIAQILFCQFVFAQQRGGGVRVVKTNADGSKQDVQLYDGSYALVIGNSEYLLGWDRLTGVKSDVIAVSSVLKKHGFKVEVEENLTSEQFERRLRKFINAYGYDRDNRLVIYYAGHGYTLGSAGDKRELGYIIPYDTPLPAKDERGFRQKAISMYAIQTFAKEIQAKHALFVFDSCFSGRLFALRDTLKITPFIVEKVDYSVRQFITAGNETQTVPDESIFRRAFVRGLEGEADRNNDTYITGTELADYLKEVVTNYTNRRQTPQYGIINDIDLDRGDIVFVGLNNSVNNSGNQTSATSRIDAAAIEREYWEAIKNSTDVDDFKLYKEKYPNGIYGNLADLRVRQLTRIIARQNSTPNNTASNRANTSTRADNVELIKFQDANGKYGYKNEKNGAIIIAPKYDVAYSFYDGLANVALNGKQGYINKRGEVVIPLKYNDVAVSFTEGLARVKLGGKWGFIDKTDNVIIPIKYDDAAGSFVQGLAWVKLNNRYGYIDKTNQVVIPFKYDDAWSFSGDAAKVKLDGKCGFIDKTGKVVFPFKYEDVGLSAEGLTKVKLNDKWGFIDKTDKLVIPFKYDGAWSFNNGLANVLLDGKQGYIDKAGNVVIPLKYDNVSTSFQEGLAWVKLNNKYCFIDKTDRVVIPCKYDDANGFSGGKAKVKFRGREFYIDKNGNEVAPN